MNTREKHWNKLKSHRENQLFSIKQYHFLVFYLRSVSSSINFIFSSDTCVICTVGWFAYGIFSNTNQFHRQKHFRLQGRSCYYWNLFFMSWKTLDKEIMCLLSSQIIIYYQFSQNKSSKQQIYFPPETSISLEYEKRTPLRGKENSEKAKTFRWVILFI